ncbi:hypothetical protein LG348_14220, partial [Lactiplantibacillus argentoratensis]|nr:hypothetical protein [Lactiplantibacillus argentoratensis]
MIWRKSLLNGAYFGIAVRPPMRVLFRPPGLGDNCWNVSRRRFELTHNPRHLKYESYSKPEEN